MEEYEQLFYNQQNTMEATQKRCMREFPAYSVSCCFYMIVFIPPYRYLPTRIVQRRNVRLSADFQGLYWWMYLLYRAG